VIDGEEIHKPGTKFSRELEKIKDEYFETETEENIKKFLDDSLFLGKNNLGTNPNLNKSMTSSFYRTSNGGFLDNNSSVSSASQKKTPLMYIRPNSSSQTTRPLIGGKKFELIDKEDDYKSYMDKLNDQVFELRTKYISIVSKYKKDHKEKKRFEEHSQSFSLDDKVSDIAESMRKSLKEGIQTIHSDKFKKNEFIASREEREEAKAKEKTINIR
jgi:hypothetical protein